jgi:hypothetical protein
LAASRCCPTSKPGDMNNCCPNGQACYNCPVRDDPVAAA